MQHIRVALVDPTDLSRNGLEAMLNKANGIKLEGAFRDLASCEVCLNQGRIHVLLLDDDLPRGADVGQVIQGLREEHPTLAIIVLSSRLQARYVHRLLGCGARGFIYKQDRLQETLVIGIEAARNGDLFLSPKASALPYKERLLRNPDDLQHRDVEILRLMAQGYTVQEIAAQLGLASRSVYRLRGRLRAALNVRRTSSWWTPPANAACSTMARPARSAICALRENFATPAAPFCCGECTETHPMCPSIRAILKMASSWRPLRLGGSNFHPFR